MFNRQNVIFDRAGFICSAVQDRKMANSVHQND